MADMSWQCVEVDEPADVVGYKDATAGAGPDAFDEAMAWVDASCLADCSTGDGLPCTSGSCTTSAGAWVEYASETTLSGDEYCYTRHERTTIDVTPPAGAASWSWLHVEQDDADSSCGSAGSGSTSYSVAWTGTLREEWPEDAAFDSSSWSGSDIDSARYDGASWSDAACAWSTQHHQDYAGWEITVSGADVEVWENHSDCGVGGVGSWLEGAFYGWLDADTWELLAPDADGDGWPAEMDCDDTDAAFAPCAEDTAHDGIDQDCDGADSIDADGDRYDADFAGGDDCDDTDAATHPRAEDVPYDGIDQDCDGADFADVDGDGYDADFAGGDDCADRSPSRNPGAAEVCGNRLDEDCDGVADPCPEDTGVSEDTAPPADTGDTAAAPPAPPPVERGCWGRWSAAFLLVLTLGAGRVRRASRRSMPT